MSGRGLRRQTAEISQLIVREDRVAGSPEHRVGKEWGGAGRKTAEGVAWGAGCQKSSS